METRKATPPRVPDLALYALAQARAAEVEEAYRPTCTDCPGPGEPGGCETRKRVPVAGRVDWPDCPLAMLRAPTWQQIVERYILSKVSPLAVVPSQLSAFASEALVELHTAVRREEDRAFEAARSGSAHRGPTFTGRSKAPGSGPGGKR